MDGEIQQFFKNIKVESFESRGFANFLEIYSDIFKVLPSKRLELVNWRPTVDEEEGGMDDEDWGNLRDKLVKDLSVIVDNWESQQRGVTSLNFEVRRALCHIDSKLKAKLMKSGGLVKLFGQYPDMFYAKDSRVQLASSPLCNKLSSPREEDRRTRISRMFGNPSYTRAKRGSNNKLDYYGPSAQNESPSPSPPADVDEYSIVVPSSVDPCDPQQSRDEEGRRSPINTMHKKDEALSHPQRQQSPVRVPSNNITPFGSPSSTHQTPQRILQQQQKNFERQKQLFGAAAIKPPVLIMSEASTEQQKKEIVATVDNQQQLKTDGHGNPHANSYDNTSVRTISPISPARTSVVGVATTSFANGASPVPLSLNYCGSPMMVGQQQQQQQQQLPVMSKCCFRTLSSSISPAPNWMIAQPPMTMMPLMPLPVIGMSGMMNMMNPMTMMPQYHQQQSGMFHQQIQQIQRDRVQQQPPQSLPLPPGFFQCTGYTHNPYSNRYWSSKDQQFTSKEKFEEARTKMWERHRRGKREFILDQIERDEEEGGRKMKRWKAED